MIVQKVITKCDGIITNCDSLVYYKVRWTVVFKLRQLFYYKVRHGLLQIATGITNRERYYKVRWLLQIATVHLSSRGWQVGRQSVAQPFNHAKQLVMLRLSSSHPVGNNFPCYYLHFLYYYYYCCCCCCLWWNLFLGLLVLRLSISS